MAWFPAWRAATRWLTSSSGTSTRREASLNIPEIDRTTAFFDKKARSIEYGYYHGYRLFDREGLEPAFAHGFGLSYTEYRYSDLQVAETWSL